MKTWNLCHSGKILFLCNLEIMLFGNPHWSFMTNNRLFWIMLTKLTHINDFHDPSNHENGFIGDFNRKISIF